MSVNSTKYFKSILALFLFFICCCQQRDSLIDLQKAYLFADSDQERTEIINNLEDYYLNLALPDSIQQDIDEEIELLLDTSKIELQKYLDHTENETNVYVLENHLKVLIKNIIICQARNDIHLSLKLLELARKTSLSIDEGKQNSYWVAFIERIVGYNNEETLAWLKANCAASFSSSFHNNDLTWQKGELYAALALQQNLIANDQHLQLDILQRLQVILYKYRAFYELSFGLAKKSLQLMNEINYPLRECGVLYNYANALFHIGKNDEAQIIMEELINKTNKYSKVPSMNWYKNSGLIRIIPVYARLGLYEKALTLSDSIVNLNLTSSQKISVYVSKGNIEKDLANYELCEKSYQNALKLVSKDKVNDRIIIINNFGTLAQTLTEYDKALDYYNNALRLQNEFNPNDYDYKIGIIINKAEIMAVQNNHKAFNELLEEANEIVQLITLPLKQAQIKRMIGKLNLNHNEYQQAQNFLKDAIRIYSENNQFRHRLEARIDLIKCLLKMNYFREAKSEIDNAYKEASEYNDTERLIDAIALNLQLQLKKNNHKEIPQITKMLINKIEETKSSLIDKSKLKAYNQKIYDYLKTSVFADISNSKIESAFIKLQYAKSFILKRNHDIKTKFSFLDNNIKNIQNNIANESLLIDFFMYSDKLYAFVLDKYGLQLFKKQLNMRNLGIDVNHYLELIKNTKNIFENYNSKIILDHFEKTNELGSNIFKQLFGWEKLIELIKSKKQIFIVPDEFLYDIPFSALVVQKSKKVKFLSEMVSIINYPNSSIFENQDSSLFDIRNKKILISADPSFPGVIKFVSFMKSIAPKAEILTSEDKLITKEYILKKLQNNFDIVIIIGHGQANRINSDLSYIEFCVQNSLAPKKIKISVSDLKQNKWKAAEFVMLIGCETASGKIYRGTGISGLQQEFLSLGSDIVLASNWKIDAELAIKQAFDIIKGLSNRENIETSVNECQKNSIKSLELDNYYVKPHPYLWGSYKLLKKSL